MKKLVFVIMLAVVASVTYGQKVNLSGNWKLNETKSELGDQFSLAPDVIILKHSKKTLEVEKHGSMQGEDYVVNDLFTLDGEKCKNPGFTEESVKTSTATWDKKTKLLKVVSLIPMQDGSEVEITEEMTIKEGSLVIESTAASAYGDLFETFVFDKE